MQTDMSLQSVGDLSAELENKSAILVDNGYQGI